LEETQQTVLMKQLLEAGVHFGHQTKRWNPKMKQYIFGERKKIYIIDLEKTVEQLTRACNFMKETATQGGAILFVGTKKQAQAIIKEEAQKCDMFYVTERWLGGTMTNFGTIRKSIKRLVDLERMKAEGIIEQLSKKEASQLSKEMAKLHKNLDGIKNMDRLPAAIYLVDPKKEEIVVREANKLGIPVAALIDTNCDPDRIDFVIPGNDDALRAIKLVTSMISESVKEGRKNFRESNLEVESGIETVKSPAPEKEPVVEKKSKPASSAKETKPKKVKR